MQINCPNKMLRKQDFALVYGYECLVNKDKSKFIRRNMDGSSKTTVGKLFFGHDLKVNAIKLLKNLSLFKGK